MLKRINLPLVGILLACALVAVGAYVADWHQIGRSLAGVDEWFVLLAAAFLVVTLVIFAARWRQLIPAESPLPMRDLFSFLMIGYLANALLPARPGDLIRAVLLRQRFQVSMSYGLASLVLERLIDLAAVCVLGIVMSVSIPVPKLLLSAIYGVSGAVFVLLALLLVASRHREFLSGYEADHPRLFRYRFVRFVAELLVRFVQGISIATSPRRVLASVALTAAGWTLLAAFTMSMIAAFHLPVPLSAALLVLIGTNLGALLPLSPGAVGVWHFMAVLALAYWKIDASTAIAFAIGSHAVVMGLHVMLGAACASYEGINLRTLAKVTRTKGAI